MKDPVKGEDIKAYIILRKEYQKKITEQEIQDSFIGKQVSEGLAMTKSGNAGPRQFDAITGATETSKALEKILKRGFERYFQVVNN